MTFPTESGYQYLIVLLNVVQTAISGNESCDFLSVLDKLNTDALPDGRVRLLRLYANFFEDYSLGMRCSTERVSLSSCSEMRLLVIFVVPSLITSM